MLLIRHSESLLELFNLSTYLSLASFASRSSSPGYTVISDHFIAQVLENYVAQTLCLSRVRSCNFETLP